MQKICCSFWIDMLHVHDILNINCSLPGNACLQRRAKHYRFTFLESTCMICSDCAGARYDALSCVCATAYKVIDA